MTHPHDEMPSREQAVELPEPLGVADIDVGPFKNDLGEEIGRITQLEDAYTADQMRAYGRQCAAQAIEAAQADAARAEECTELAQALEQRRALSIAEAVQALPVGGSEAEMPTQFHAGFQLACEEIIHRLRTEVWDLCLPPVDAAIDQARKQQEVG